MSRLVDRRVALGLAGGVLLAALVGAGGAWAASPDFAAFGLQPYQPPKPAPALALPDLEGRTVRLDDLQGKVVMLFFWTTW